MRLPLRYQVGRIRRAGAFSRLGNDRGFALILALGMLVLLSILGVMSLSDSATELGIAGNYRAGSKAFTAADRALEYALIHGPTLSGDSSLNLTDPDKGISADTQVQVDNSGLYSASGENTLTFLAKGAAPPGSGSDATVGSGFQAFYYVIRVEGAYPLSASNPSRCKLKTQFAQIVPE